MEKEKLKAVGDALRGIDEEMRARRYGVALELAYQASRYSAW